MKIIGFYESKKIRQIKNELDFAELTATKIMKNSTMKNNTIITLGSLLYIQNTCVLANNGITTSLDNLGFKILGSIQWLGTWLCVIMCLKEVIQTALQGGRSKDLGSIFIKYLIVLGSLYFIPKFFMEVPTYLND